MERSESDCDLSEENMNNKNVDVDTGNSASNDGLSGKIKVERDGDTECSRSDGNWCVGNTKVDEYADTIKVKQENNLDPEGETFPGIKTEAIFLKIEDNGSGTKGKIKVERGVYTESSRSDDNWWETNIKVEEDADTNSYDPNQDKLELEEILDLEGEMFPDVKTEELILKHEDKGSGTGAEKYSCRHCGFSTINKQSLQRHFERLHRPGSDEWYQCHRCDFRTKIKWYLKKHATTIHETGSAQKFFCCHCEYSTMYKQHLQNHIVAIHQTGPAKNIVCDLCDFKTTTDSYLKMHVKNMHGSGATELYPCDRCDFRSKSKSYLKKHVITIHETGAAQKFFCNHCDYNTIYKQHLQNHIVAIHPTRPATQIPCDLCGFKTTSDAYLKMHVKKMHGSGATKIHRCDRCHFGTKTKSYLKKHIKLIHDSKSLPTSSSATIVNSSIRSTSNVNLYRCDFRTKNKRTSESMITESGTQHFA